jgi:hypothetical protein
VDKATLGELDFLFGIEEVLDLGIQALDLFVVGLDEVLLALLNVIKFLDELEYLCFSCVCFAHMLFSWGVV